jgi:hypothetical protein
MNKKKPKPKPKGRRFKAFGFLTAGIRKRKRPAINRPTRSTAQADYKGVGHRHYSRKLSKRSSFANQTKLFKNKRTYITIEGKTKDGKRIQRNSFVFRFTKKRYQKFLAVLNDKYGTLTMPIVYITRIEKIPHHKGKRKHKGKR